MFSVPLRHRVCRVAATTYLSCGGQHKVARLPVGKIDRREKILCWMHESSRSGEFRWMTERSTTLSASVLVTPTLFNSLADEPFRALMM
jgi:hypothetical protein